MVFSLPFNNFSLHILVFSLLITLGNFEFSSSFLPTKHFIIGYLQNPPNSPKMGKIPYFLPDKQGRQCPGFRERHPSRTSDPPFFKALRMGCPFCWLVFPTPDGARCLLDTSNCLFIVSRKEGNNIVYMPIIAAIQNIIRNLVVLFQHLLITR